jgi:hypothetical protein
MATTIGQRDRPDGHDDDGHDDSEKAKTLTFTVNNQPFTTSSHELTGLEIKTLAGLPPDYELFAIKGAKSTPVANDDRVRLHKGEEFRAIPAGTFG